MLCFVALACTPASASPVPGTRQPVDPQAAWLAYSPVDAARVFPTGTPIPDTLLRLGDSALETTAADELHRGFEGMLHRILSSDTRTNPPEHSRNLIVVGTASEIAQWRPSLSENKLAPAGFHLRRIISGKDTLLVVEGADERGALYGSFALLRLIAEEHSLAHLDDLEAPAAPVRWTNEWDNPNGSIERGYGGRSIFFDRGNVREDLTRASEYARLLASVGINGCTINNVNADPNLLRPEQLRQIARIAAAFRPYGVRLSLSIAMNSPEVIGGLTTFDPLAPEVAAWWQTKVDAIYKAIPDFGGVIIKADSEGQPGPSQYGRTPAEAANVVARALKPHGGLVLYRGFVYNHHLDWRDPRADRARAGYDNFHSLDGQFDSNVIVQIKNGPIDFQVREPVSPLFAGLHKTNEAIELQITQEYTGQQRHLVFLVPMWKNALDTDMHVPGAQPSRVRDIVTGKTFARPEGGFVGVANVGLDDYWLGHPLAMANLYGFGRLAWNPSLHSATISNEWTRLTFGNDADVLRVVNSLLLNSWHTYEDYTGPLGAGTLTDIIGPHYGPGIESAERNGWGQWIRADHNGIGMDRTVATGTGYIGQYPAGLAAQYETLKACPDVLLLFMHHVPYTYRLHSGKTVIQYIYDTHYAGAAAAAAQVPAWETLAGKVPDRTYFEVLRRLNYQAGHAIVWRDAVVNWFHQMSGIADVQNRVGYHPNRIEAEAMQLTGYTPVAVTPWETASGGKAVVCHWKTCEASTTLARPDGWYNIAVQYFDLRDGVSHLTLEINDSPVDTWAADDTLPSDNLNGHTSTRHTTTGVALHRGDRIRIIGEPGGNEPAPLDYLEITPAFAGTARDAVKK
ncbi:alpha-glucuronidase family glycosyl hydrolase [Edaphobacter sp.]|uniref:alpha-glucuronidase family glycosyl hydrolase n=1 Tax=Edaphobacter sp. TaxID=1934404 RepID=UPI002DB7684D|nr:alpha-glucuronidase family glycosyl hydrolase [Edaphobacter sp.]HEU5341991.1 alpha-glucuronidase family glycosyl hydrolase [Edaphobacter sp.]